MAIYRIRSYPYRVVTAAKITERHGVLPKILPRKYTARNVKTPYAVTGTELLPLPDEADN